MNNPLIATDVYKLGHMEQYEPGITQVYSYLQARSKKKLPFTVFFGLQYYLKKYLSVKPTREMVEEFFDLRKSILGVEPSEDIKKKLYGLVDLGYFPLRIKALPEGSVVDVGNALMTITNTHPEYYWLVGFFESLLLKVWNTSTVASFSLKLRLLVEEHSRKTCENNDLIPFQVHDFGYRGCSSEETAALSGASHLLNFLGTDTVPAVKLLKTYYSAKDPIGLSVPASEHSVMCSFGQDREIEAFKHMLKLYPKGIVSIVADTYNLWNVLEHFTEELSTQILSRDGKVVFRPDSGDPENILLGDRNAIPGSPEYKGVLQLLSDKFGYTVNAKGFKQLNPKIGVIYGDGMYFDRFKSILERMTAEGWATSNLVVGIGGLLLQQHSRDDQGYAIKAVHAVINGESRELMKDPVTDSSKRSYKGLLSVARVDSRYITLDQMPIEEESKGCLEVVYENGVVVKDQTLLEIRQRVLEESRVL